MKHWTKIARVKSQFDRIPLEYHQRIIYDVYEIEPNIDGATRTKQFRAVELLCDIYINNNYSNDCLTLYRNYKSANNMDDKLIIRYGTTKLNEYKTALKNRPITENHTSIWTIEHWVKRGHSHEEAILKISEIQRNNTIKRKPEGYLEHSKKIKHSNDYWLALGYSLEEAEQLRYPYLLQMLCNKEGFIFRHGEVEGEIKYSQSIASKYESFKKNPILVPRVSKESLKFLVPIYKYCRKLGIPKQWIYFGIGGSKEFFIRKDGQENAGYFYDFVITNLNIIIEYHGTFWHPREDIQWRNGYFSQEEAIQKDIDKQLLAENRNMCYNVVWSDDNKQEQLNKLKSIIFKMWTDYDRTIKL